MPISDQNLVLVTELLLDIVEQANDIEDQSDENLEAIATVFEKVVEDTEVVLNSTVSWIKFVFVSDT